MVASASSVGRTWGSTERERAESLPCDRYISAPKESYHRAVDIAAPAAVVFRWLCQLRAAPYSYDLLDNFGRQSPRELTPGLEQLEVGQRVMTIFDLVEFEQDRHLTLVVRRARRLFGDVAVTYLVTPAGPDSSRLVVRIVDRTRSASIISRLRRMVMPWLDLFMMRKQLLTLKRLAEGQVRRGARH
jgi:hypothetical protein